MVRPPEPVLRTAGRGEPHRIQAEVVRYFGWPGQAISYKLGERGWLAARAEAMRRPGFDLKRWHTAALSLGPIGLAGLADALSRADPNRSSGHGAHDRDSRGVPGADGHRQRL